MRGCGKRAIVDSYSRSRPLNLKIFSVYFQRFIEDLIGIPGFNKLPG
jgi:hypothetical protein